MEEQIDNILISFVQLFAVFFEQLGDPGDPGRFSHPGDIHQHDPGI